MYRVETIKNGFKNLIGWREHWDSQAIPLNADLKKSESGVYYQDAHPMLTLENIKRIAPDFTGYQDGESKFNTWLRTKTDASIMNVVSKLINDKIIGKTASEVMESKTLFDKAGRMADIVRKTGSIVGFELIPVRADGVTTEIQKIGFQFSKPTSVCVELYHSSSSTAIKSQTFSYTKSGSIQWFDFADEWLMPYVSDNNDAGGSWYIVYRESGLDGNSSAINKNRDWSKEPCKACDLQEYYSHLAWSQWLEVHPFKVSENESGLWDVARNVYTYETNYGLNLQIAVKCDVTDVILKQKNLFVNAIQLQVASDMLREMAYNPQFRINRTAQNLSRDEILYELDGGTESSNKGLSAKLERAIKAIDISLQGISRVCLPCESKGIRYRSI